MSDDALNAPAVASSPREAIRQPVSVVLSDAERSAPMTNRERRLMLAVYRHCEIQEGFDPGESMWGLDTQHLFNRVIKASRKL